jgi:hypothetical protein
VKHSKRPTSTGGPRWPRVEVWAPVLALAVIAALVWASFWSDSVVGDSPAGQTGASQGSSRPAGTEDHAQPGEGAGEPDASGTGSTAASLEESVRRFRAAQRRLAAKVSQQLERRSQPFEFRVASLNVLGDSHTGSGGNKGGFPDASPRMDMTIAGLRNNGIDVVGFQEFEATQFNMFSARAGEYSLYPGLSLGTKSVRFNIAWRSSMWKLVEAHTLSIPYAGGSRIAMPVVLLESTSTGRRAWFANFHNPADTANLGNNGRWRSEAAGIEISHLTELYQTSGHPVISTGDYNEREEIFCRFTAGGVFTAAAGGSSAGGCAPPPQMEVDWIFGSTGVSFADYSVTDLGRATDHRLVHASATLTAVE